MSTKDSSDHHRSIRLDFDSEGGGARSTHWVVDAKRLAHLDMGETWSMGIFKRRVSPILVETWHDAEVLAAAHMRRNLGFRDARLTAPGADWGVDVTAKDAIAQVKFHAAKTGSPEIQRLVGVAAGKRMKRLFYSHVGYTPRAVAAAEASNIALFIYELTGVVTPINKTAQKMSKSRMASRTPEEQAEFNEKIDRFVEKRVRPLVEEFKAYRRDWRGRD